MKNLPVTHSANRAIICEDEEHVYEKIRQFLESRGFEVADRTWNNEGLSDALMKAKLSKSRYLVIMIDVSLEFSDPDESGIQIYESLCREYPDENYIIYTRQDTDTVRQQVRRLLYKRDIAFILLSNSLTQKDLGWQIDKYLPQNQDTVFLVYGRNYIKNDFMRKLLNMAFGLKVLTFAEAELRTPGKKYIYDIVMTGISNSFANIVLFTDDEEVSLRNEFRKTDDIDSTIKDGQKRRQARPNVFIEAGYLIGARARTTVLIDYPDQDAYFDKPSDFDGIYSIKFSDTPQKREELKNWLQYVGCAMILSEDWKTMIIG